MPPPRQPIGASIDPSLARVYWARRQFWVGRGSPINLALDRTMPLLACFDELSPEPPTPEAVECLLANIGVTVPAADADAFAVQAAILRATAREYHAI